MLRLGHCMSLAFWGIMLPWIGLKTLSACKRYLQYLLNHNPMLRKLSKSDCGLKPKTQDTRSTLRMRYSRVRTTEWEGMGVDYILMGCISWGNMIIFVPTPLSFRARAYCAHVEHKQAQNWKCIKYEGSNGRSNQLSRVRTLTTKFFENFVQDTKWIRQSIDFFFLSSSWISQLTVGKGQTTELELLCKFTLVIGSDLLYSFRYFCRQDASHARAHTHTHIQANSVRLYLQSIINWYANILSAKKKESCSFNLQKDTQGFNVHHETQLHYSHFSGAQNSLC